MKLKKLLEECLINNSDLARKLNIGRSTLANKLNPVQRAKFTGEQKKKIKLTITRLIYVQRKWLENPEF